MLILLALQPLEQHVLLLFLASVLVTSALELVTGFVLKKLFHTSWWDYSDEPFNIGGYVCLKFSLAWGLAGVFLVKILHPAIAGLVGIIPQTLGYVLLAVALGIFVADLIVTVNVILKLNRDLGEITRIAKGLHEGSEAIAKSLGTKAIEVNDKLSELDLEEGRAKLNERYEEYKGSAATRLDAGKEKLADKLDNSKERLEALLGRHSFSRRRLLRAFPRMQHSDYSGAVARLREKYARRKGDTPVENTEENIEENTVEK